MIEGSAIRLRRWQESDLPVMMALRNDVALQAQLLARARGSNEQQVRRWLQERSSGTDSLLFIVADRGTDAALGYLQFIGIDPVDHRADLGICLARQAQGQRAGRAALTLALPYLRDVRGLRKLNLRVRADNQAAIGCYRHVGFEQCGLLRKHVLVDGSWNDVVLMELFLTPGG